MRGRRLSRKRQGSYEYSWVRHGHPYDEVVTVLTGSYGNYFGEKFEPKGQLMKTGSLFVLPANHPHYTWTGEEETILQLQFMGPGGVEFIDPADDPRKK